MIGTALIVAALTLAVAPAAQAAEPPGPPPEGSYTSPAHAWVDPTHPTDLGRVWFAIDFHFPFPDTHWVSHAQAPRLTDGVTHCQLIKNNDEQYVTMRCEAIGTAVPGEYVAPLDVRSEGGDNFGWSVPVTVCPLDGCSPLFSLELANASWEVCPGDDLSALDPAQYVFNVAWNPDEVSVDTAGLAAAGGDPAFFSGPPADGSELSATGSLQVPGAYVVPVTITDEFGGEHTADLDITVKSAAACGQLAATGSALDQMAGVAGGMFALIALGALTVAAAARRSRASH